MDSYYNQGDSHGAPLLFAGVRLQDHRLAAVDQLQSAAAALSDLGEVDAGVPAVQQRDAGQPAHKTPESRFQGKPWPH